MTPDEQKLIRNELREMNLLLRAIWRKGKAQIEQGTELQALVKDVESHKELIYALLDREHTMNKQIFSGKQSEKLWQAINHVKEPPEHTMFREVVWEALYTLGCKCQELESRLDREK